jgi:NAD(P)H-dependent flavin oxidoreductase YrpB (nitropropane dioxygenase family)
MAAAMMLGACGIQMGTRFLAAKNAPCTKLQGNGAARKGHRHGRHRTQISAEIPAGALKMRSAVSF